jgi:broad specificity phosphatase PhoE
VPITEEGHAQARRAGRWIAEAGHEVAAVLYGGTRRTRETAEGILAGLGAAAAEVEATDAFALRNPDLYLGGDRVTMVSTAAAFAEQTRALSAEDVDDVEFFRTWLQHPDRVGWWAAHPAPPGDDATAVAGRVDAFARSLADVPAWRGRTVVAVTHSPVLRAVALARRGSDPGEPAYVSGFACTVTADAVAVDDLIPTTA